MQSDSSNSDNLPAASVRDIRSGALLQGDSQFKLYNRVSSFHVYVAIYTFHLFLPSQCPLNLNNATVPTRAVTFNLQDQYIKDLPGTPNSLWDMLIPRESNIILYSRCSIWMLSSLAGRGFIIVKDPRSLGLSGGLPVPDGELSSSGSEGYCISVFHQLHCLVS